MKKSHERQIKHFRDILLTDLDVLDELDDEIAKSLTGGGKFVNRQFPSLSEQLPVCAIFIKPKPGGEFGELALCIECATPDDLTIPFDDEDG
ncbi:MAG: hypothetical protein AAGA16_09515 [Cyanobacteria bacterium P01_E01_bin.35]